LIEAGPVHESSHKSIAVAAGRRGGRDFPPNGMPFVSIEGHYPVPVHISEFHTSQPRSAARVVINFSSKTSGYLDGRVFRTSIHEDDFIGYFPGTFQACRDILLFIFRDQAQAQFGHLARL
jgi:hypothetical protein